MLIIWISRWSLDFTWLKSNECSCWEHNHSNINIHFFTRVHKNSRVSLGKNSLKEAMYGTNHSSDVTPQLQDLQA